MPVPKGTRVRGRQKGTPNKAGRELREMARKYGPQAIREMAKLAGLIEGEKSAETEQVRKAALDSVLDRGYGKAAQAVTGEGGEGPVAATIEVRFVGAGKSDKG